jgi:hypothetical protein
VELKCCAGDHSWQANRRRSHETLFPNVAIAFVLAAGLGWRCQAKTYKYNVSASDNAVSRLQLRLNHLELTSSSVLWSNRFACCETGTFHTNLQIRVTQRETLIHQHYSILGRVCPSNSFHNVHETTTPQHHSFPNRW